jgi:hypothetical protein
MSFLSHIPRVAAAILVAIALVACGDSEPGQRKAFIGFLQEMNSRPGVHFLLPTAADEKAFGPYLQHYEIFVDFNKDMQAATNDYFGHLRQLGVGPGSTPRTIEQMAAAPQDLPAAKDLIDKMQQTIEARLAKLIAAPKCPGATRRPQGRLRQDICRARYGSVVGAGELHQGAGSGNRQFDQARRLHQYAS